MSDRDIGRLPSILGTASFARGDKQEAAGYAEIIETLLEIWEYLPFTEIYTKPLDRDLFCPSGKDI